MAYQTGAYGAGHMQRPQYPGQGAPHAQAGRPSPAQMQPQGARQPYGDYPGGRSFTDQGAGYRPGHDRQFQDYGRAPGPPPPRDYYSAGARGQGGPILRPATADGRRAGQQPPRGNLMTNGTNSGRRMVGQDAGYGRPHDLAGQMSGMAISGQPDGDYLPHGYGTANHGQPLGPTAEGYDGHFDGERQQYIPAEYSAGGVGPPGRSMTMPTRQMDTRQQDMVSLQRNGTAPPHAAPAGRGVPPRPSTASGSRPQPRRMHPQDPQGMSAYGQAEGEPIPSADDVFNSYFDNGPAAGNAGQGPPPPRGPAQGPNYYEAPFQRPGGSYEQNYDQNYEQNMRHQQPQRGAHQTPRLYHAKSEATLREPQAAVFEMAGDTPSVPPVPSIQSYQPQFAEGYGAGSAGGYGTVQPPPRGPSAPPGAANGHPRGHDGLSRTKTSLSQNSSNPDALPSHPTPVRPGLMQQTTAINLNDRPPPIRNYGGVPQSGPTQMQAMPPQQVQRSFARVGHEAPEIAPVSDPVTTQELESLRMAIKANPGDQASAFRLSKRLIEASDVLVSKAPDAKQRNKMRERFLLDAHKILKKLANTQHQDAMFVMADGLGKGLFGHEPDNKEAFTLYQSAAKMGHAAAAYRTAVCCEIGHEEGGGTRKDPLKAMQWYKRAAMLGDPPAMYKVGMILLKGLLGQPKNPREAVGWLKRAAERADSENPHALHELGLLYESAQPNDAILRDERYALTLFLQAADLGYKFSQFQLGCAFEYGLLGCPIDPRQSIYWYSKAATQEEHQSELALSGWYLTGSDGVLGQSDTEAYLWARKAAVAGLAKAEYAMGYFTEVGIGIAANLEDAKRWYWRAAAQDFPKARERLEDLKRAGKNGRPRQRERISRSRIEKHQEGECSVM